MVDPALLAEDGIRDYDMFVDGGHVEATSGNRFAVEYPYTREQWATVPRAGPDDVDRAIGAARETFESEAWQSLTATERGELLYALADIIDGRIDELAPAESLGNGKPLAESEGQITSLATRLRYYAGLADKITGDTIPVDADDTFTFTRREPYGVVGAITPYNSPLSLSGFKIPPAVAAGNTVVLKPSEETPVSSILLAELAAEAGWPDGVLNVVTGMGETGAALTGNADVDVVTFTGGVETGRKVAEAAGRNLTPVLLELGGKSPNIIFPDADLDAAVGGAIRGIFASAGQTCVAGSRLFLHDDVHDEFLDRLVERAEEMVLGDPFEEDTDVGPVISADAKSRIQRFVDGALEEGATLLTGGSPRDDLQGGLCYPPTVLADVTDEMEVACDEVFGPVLSVLSFEAEDEALERANDTSYGLAAGVWTNDVSRALRFTEELEAGNVWVNTYRQLSMTTPFGGYKDSGIGRENGIEGIEEFLQTKSVRMDYAEDRADTQYP